MWAVWYGCWEQYSGLLEEQFITEQSLQLLPPYFLKYLFHFLLNKTSCSSFRLTSNSQQSHLRLSCAEMIGISYHMWPECDFWSPAVVGACWVALSTCFSRYPSGSVSFNAYGYHGFLFLDSFKWVYNFVCSLSYLLSPIAKIDKLFFFKGSCHTGHILCSVGSMNFVKSFHSAVTVGRNL